MDLEENNGCNFDYLEIYENIDSKNSSVSTYLHNNITRINKLSKRVCGSDFQEGQQFTFSNMLLIRFVTDHNTNKGGFKVIVTATLGYFFIKIL